MGRGLSFTNAARWFGAVAGLALAGYAIEALGMRTALLLAFVLVPVAVLMVARIRPKTDQTAQEVETGLAEDALRIRS